MVETVELIRGKDNFLEIDGEKYYIETIKNKKIDGIEHEDKVIYKRVNEKELKELKKRLAIKLSNKLTKGELIEELLSGYSLKELRAFVKRAESKEIKKQAGCLGFKIGDKYCELISS